MSASAAAPSDSHSSPRSVRHPSRTPPSSHTAAAHPAIAATHKITLIEASQLDKVAAWELPSSEYSNRVSSVTASNAAFLQGSFHLLVATF